MAERSKASGAVAGADRIRLDKWLWAARFYKTRSLAAAAISGGKVHSNGARVKPGRVVAVDDELTIGRAGVVMTVMVRALSGRRGPASVAEQLYAETEQSRLDRQQEAEQRRLIRQPAPNPGTRPNKKARRDMARFSGR
jgi:ribosome-associated heat shock protein Hsp15